MPKITIIDGNDEIELSTAPKENIKAFMVKGEPGTDGTSPTASVSKVDDTTTITITDKNGTTEADVLDGYSPTVTASKTNKVTTITMTDINGTTTTTINDGIDLTGGVPTNGVIGFDITELIYNCDGTESGDYYFTYNSVDYYFTMPTVEDGDVLTFNTTDLILSLNNTTITTSSSGTGTELIFNNNIPNGYEETNEPFPGGGGGGSITVHDSYSTSTTEPYSANYVNGTLTDVYSTSEVKTNKIWINGKPIYRKIIYIPNLPNNANTSYDTGITETLEYVFFDLGHSYYSWTNGIDYNFRSNITALNYQKSTNKISITSNTNLSSFWAYICLEYTKTTD